MLTMVARASINLVSNIGLGDKESRSKDILGRVYEYFLSQFASAEGRGFVVSYPRPARPVAAVLGSIQVERPWYNTIASALPAPRPTRSGEPQGNNSGPPLAGIDCHDTAHGVA